MRLRPDWPDPAAVRVAPGATFVFVSGLGGYSIRNQDRCLPWAYNIPCIVCEEACPVAEKAIWLEEVQAVNAEGESVLLQRPQV